MRMVQAEYELTIRSKRYKSFNLKNQMEVERIELSSESHQR